MESSLSPSEEAIENSNMFLIGTAYGLKSFLSKRHIITELTSGKLGHPYPRLRFGPQESLEKEVEVYLTTYKDITHYQRQHKDEHKIRLEEEQQRLTSKLRVYTTQGRYEREELGRLQDEISDGAQEKIAESSLAKLDSFNLQFTTLVQAQQEKLVELKEARVSTSTLDHAIDSVEETWTQISADSHATAALMSTLEADVWHMPILACFSGDNSAEEGWTEVWQGMRLRTQGPMKR